MPELGDFLMAIFFFGVLVIVVAFSVPYIINIQAEDAHENLNMTVGDTDELNKYLDITLDATNTTPANRTVNVSLSNPDTLNETTITRVNDTENQTVELDNENVTVEPIKVNDSTAELRVDYPSTFGWHPAARVVIENLGLFMALIVFTIMIGLVLIPLVKY